MTLGAKTGQENLKIDLIQQYVTDTNDTKMFISVPSKPRLKKRNPELKLKEFKNQITIGFPETVNDITKNIKVKFFSNGTLHITGCNTTDLINKTIDKAVNMLNSSNSLSIEKESVYLSVDIYMINKTFDAGYKINQRVLTSILTDKYNIMSIFNPKEYAGIKSVYYTEKQNKSSFLIFQSGKVTVAGSRDVETLVNGYEKIKTILKDEKSVIQIIED